MSAHNRRATRASGRAALSGSIEDVIKEAKTTALREKRAFREKKYDGEWTPQFHPFLRLPRELRACIYFLAMEDAGSPRQLSTLRAPSLALVSKQVQEEAIPVFLARCTFYVDVKSNYEDITKLDEKASDGTLGTLYAAPGRTCCIEATALHSGRCEPLSKRTRLWFAKMQGDSEDLFFPNLELHITPSRCCGGRRHSPPHSQTSILSLRTQNDHLVLRSENPENTSPSLLRLLSNAETAARHIAAKHKKHEGFCCRELDEIAISFRYWPPGAPERK